MSAIVIGLDASARTQGAIAFGRRMAEATGADLVITDFASPRALQESSRELGAGLVIVGAAHTGRLRRLLGGSTGERLVHSAHCPVAVVPDTDRADGAVRCIGVAYDGSAEATAALAAAAALARAFGAELELIGLVTREYAISPEAVDGKGPDFARHEVETRTQERLDAAATTLPTGLDAHTRRRTGDPVGLLAERSADLDLLVMGSRGYGPLHSLLVGGLSGRVLRTAHCPVIVVARGTERRLQALLDHPTTAAA
jgi:nucleotide-binding universal stress UspA family protein